MEAMIPCFNIENIIEHTCAGFSSKIVDKIQKQFMEHYSVQLNNTQYCIAHTKNVYDKLYAQKRICSRDERTFVFLSYNKSNEPLLSVMYCAHVLDKTTQNTGGSINFDIINKPFDIQTVNDIYNFVPFNKKYEIDGNQIVLFDQIIAFIDGMVKQNKSLIRE
jgi:hypothetical protein